MIIISAHSAKSEGSMAYTGLCAGSLNDYTLPGRRLEIDRKFFGADVDEVIKVSKVDGVVKWSEAELVTLQRLTLRSFDCG